MTGFSVSHSVSPGTRVLETRERNDITGVSRLDVDPVVRVHQKHAADALLLLLRRVQDARAGLDMARIDARKGDRADERVVHDLEGKHRERLGIVRLANDLCTGLDIDALDRGYVDRRGKILDDGIEQGLDALVLERRATQDRG